MLKTNIVVYESKGVSVQPVGVEFQIVLVTGRVACPQLNKLVKNAKKNNFVFIIFKNIVCKI